MRPTLSDWLMLNALGLVWGASFMATKVATADFTPLTLAALRLGIAAAAILLLLRLRGGRLPPVSDRSFWAFAAGVALLSNAMPFTSLAWAQRHIDSGLAGVLMATSPLFVLPLGHVFVEGERLTWRRAAGCLLGFAGVCVLVGPPAVAAALGSAGAVGALAIGACLLTAFGYASGSILSKRAPQRGLVAFGAAALTIAATTMIPLALLVEGLPGSASAEGLLATAYLGLVPTALATIMLLAVIGSAGPGFLTNVNYLVPVWAVLLGTLVLGETPSPRLAAAMALILAGVALAQVRIGLRRGGHARG